MRRPKVGAIPVESVSMIRKTTALMNFWVKLFKGLLRETLVERKRNGKVPSQHLVLTLLVECVADIATQITCKVQMAALVARDCLANKYLEQAWTLERASCGASIVPTI